MSSQPDISKLPLAKVLLYSLVPTLILLGVLEGGARVVEWVRPPLPADYGMGFDDNSRVFMPAGVLRPVMTTRPQKEISFVSQSFITPKPPNTYRIFFLGESNVNYLQWRLGDFAKRLEAADPRGRHFEIINMGGLAYGSYRLLKVAQEIINYEPDLLLVYIGHNEFEEMDQQELAAPQRAAFQRQVYRSAFMRLLRDISANGRITYMRLRMANAKLPPEVNYMSTFGHDFSTAEIDQRMDGYRKNMGGILSTFRDRGVPVIMGVMATNLWKPDLLDRFKDSKEEVARLYAAGDYQAGMALARKMLSTTTHHQASDRENGIIQDLAKEYGATLVDIQAAISKAEPHGVSGETLFSDRCHVNGPGQEILLAEYEKAVRGLAGIPEAKP
jgi:lysophospholipase L1-like esterase